MTNPNGTDPGDGWKPKALRDAESALSATMTKSEELAREMDQIEIPEHTRQAAPEDVAAIKAAAERADAPEEMRVLKRKVDTGDLSWRDILEGRAYQDPEVRAALSAKLGEMREVYQEFEDGHTLDEVLQAAGQDDPLSADPLRDDSVGADSIGDDPPGSTARPPGPADHDPVRPPHEDSPRRAEPPGRHRASDFRPMPPADEYEDYFGDPLAEEGPADDSPPRRGSSDDSEPPEEDYFDGSPFDR